LENLTYGISDMDENVETTIYGVSKNQDTINRVSTNNKFQQKITQAIKDAKCEFIYDFKD
jgi:hypothetical protein